MVYDKVQKRVVPISQRQDAPIVNRSSVCRDGFYVVPDMEPVKMISLPGAPVVTSRSQYRQLLKENEAYEVGNDMPAWLKERKYEQKHGRKD
jgi:hypothetical protein